MAYGVLSPEESNARNSAYRALAAFQRSGGFSEEALEEELKRSPLSEKDRALFTRIFMGVVQNRELIDFYIDAFSKYSKLQPQVRNVLRIAIFQILFLDRVPASAAVNEAVRQARKLTNDRAASLVNGLLRRFSESLGALPEPAEDEISNLAIKYSHPRWIVKKFCGLIGNVETGELLTENNSIPSISVHVNTLKTDIDGLREALAAEGIDAEPHPFFEGCLEIPGSGRLFTGRAFKDGLFTVQDVASKLVAAAAAPEPGSTVIDVCAAPGGKSIAAAIMMENTGKILAFDKNARKLGMINETAERVGVTIIKSEAADALNLDERLIGTGDVVFADVPCSGFGVIRKKPEIKYKSYDEIKYLPETQGEILNNAARYVKSGGKLIYSTCTLLPEENERVTSAFMLKNPEFQEMEIRLEEPFGKIKNGEITIWPHIYKTDGFYIRVMRKIND